MRLLMSCWKTFSTLTLGQIENDWSQWESKREHWEAPLGRRGTEFCTRISQNLAGKLRESYVKLCRRYRHEEWSELSLQLFLCAGVTMIQPCLNQKTSQEFLVLKNMNMSSTGDVEALCFFTTVHLSESSQELSTIWARPPNILAHPFPRPQPRLRIGQLWHLTRN